MLVRLPGVSTGLRMMDMHESVLDLVAIERSPIDAGVWTLGGRAMSLIKPGDRLAIVLRDTRRVPAIVEGIEIHRRKAHELEPVMVGGVIVRTRPDADLAEAVLVLRDATMS